MRTKVRVSAIIISNNKILLIHRKKEGREYWVFPGGGVEEGETNEQALIREVKEETNLDVTGVKSAFDNFYYCDVEFGKPELGSPEKLKLNADDWYQPEWVELSMINYFEFIYGGSSLLGKAKVLIN